MLTNLDHTRPTLVALPPPGRFDSQLAAFETQSPPPRHYRLVLATTAFEPVNMTDRDGEVVMIIQRPNGYLLTSIKTFYPPDCQRLLTGGIHPDEQAIDALLREIAEETSLETRLERLLGTVAYFDDQGEHRFTSILFFLHETGGTLHCADPAEEVAAFGDVAIAALPDRAQALVRNSATWVGPRCEDWPAWGIHRAAVHWAAWECLTDAAPSC